jgi:cytochrome c553
MPQHRPALARICPSCDGFASAAITLGGRDRNGQRRTITAHCRTCHGTGTVPPLRQLLEDAVDAAFTR